MFFPIRINLAFCRINFSDLDYIAGFIWNDFVRTCHLPELVYLNRITLVCRIHDKHSHLKNVQTKSVSPIMRIFSTELLCIINIHYNT